MDITKELLIKNGFKPIEIGEPYTYASKHIVNTATITLSNCTEQLNNSDRKWHCHIDDKKCQSIGNVELDTVEQLQFVCRIYDIPFNEVISTEPVVNTNIDNNNE